MTDEEREIMGRHATTSGYDCAPETVEALAARFPSFIPLRQIVLGTAGLNEADRRQSRQTPVSA